MTNPQLPDRSPNGPRPSRIKVSGTFTLAGLLVLGVVASPSAADRPITAEQREAIGRVIGGSRHRQPVSQGPGDPHRAAILEIARTKRLLDRVCARKHAGGEIPDIDLLRAQRDQLRLVVPEARARISARLRHKQAELQRLDQARARFAAAVAKVETAPDALAKDRQINALCANVTPTSVHHGTPGRHPSWGESTLIQPQRNGGQ